MAEFKRKKGESFEAFLRRFNKRLQSSGKLYLARQKKFRSKDPSRNQQKRSALQLKKIREKKEYLKKIGKLKDD